MKTLKDAKVGDVVTVARLHGEGPVKRRIMDMGITKGHGAESAEGGPPGRPDGADRARVRAVRPQS